MLQFKVNLYFNVLVPLIHVSFAEFTKSYMYHLNFKTYIFYTGVLRANIVLVVFV